MEEVVHYDKSDEYLIRTKKDKKLHLFSLNKLRCRSYNWSQSLRKLKDLFEI